MSLLNSVSLLNKIMYLFIYLFCKPNNFVLIHLFIAYFLH